MGKMIVTRGCHYPTHAIMEFGDLDEDNAVPVVVTCPECGQLELWSQAERDDHGKCRASNKPCWCEA